MIPLRPFLIKLNKLKMTFYLCFSSEENLKPHLRFQVILKLFILILKTVFLITLQVIE